MLGAVSLDLFAVLLGGAVALMPVYARDILTLGPWGLGLLRAAPSFRRHFHGPVSGNLSHPASVLGFVCSSASGCLGWERDFGISHTPWRVNCGTRHHGRVDLISVYVRETLITLWTPDHMRDRVNAVNMVFVGASNELASSARGTMAHYFGAVLPSSSAASARWRWRSSGQAVSRNCVGSTI